MPEQQTQGGGGWRSGGARALLNDLIMQVQALATVVAANSDSGMVSAMHDVAAAELAALSGIAAKIDASGDKTGALAALITTSNDRLEAIRALLAKPTPWNAVANSGALILSTTAAPLKAAAGAGLRNYVSHLQIRNANLLTEASVQILDGSTVIWSQPVAAGAFVGFPSALVGSPNTALNVRLAAALTTGVAVNAQGYVAA